MARSPWSARAWLSRASVTLAAIMQKGTGAPAKTVSIGFEADRNDETDEIMASAEFLRTDHHHTGFRTNALDEYPQALFHMEEPLADPVFTTFYKLFHACQQVGLRVVLNGGGADELFGGYYWHRFQTWVNPLLKLPYPLRALLAEISDFCSKSRAENV